MIPGRIVRSPLFGFLDCVSASLDIGFGLAVMLASDLQPLQEVIGAALKLHFAELFQSLGFQPGAGVYPVLPWTPQGREQHGGALALGRIGGNDLQNTGSGMLLIFTNDRGSRLGAVLRCF